MPTEIVRYEVADGATVVLDVAIGDGQRGHCTALLGEQQICAADTIVGLPVGEGAALRGSKLVISALVLDVRTETDWTSVELRLRGGVQSQERTLRQTSDGAPAVSYLYVVLFV